MPANIYLSQPIEVMAIRKHTSQEWSFELQWEGEKVIPGQFVMVSLPGAGEVPISVSACRSKTLEITIRSAGQVTSRLFSRTRAGDELYVRGPYGNGFPLEKFRNQHLLIIAGGSALAAAKPLIEYFLEGKDSLKRLDVLAGFKSPRHILFREEISRWQKKCRADNRNSLAIEISVDTDEDYAWLGSIGFVVNFIKTVPEIGEATRSVVIGPPAMMKNAVRELRDYRLKEKNIYLSFERHMQCGVAKCGHCRIRDKYVCLDGPVFSYSEAKELID